MPAGIRRLALRLARGVLGPRQINHLARFAPVLERISQTGLPGGSLLDVGSGSSGLAPLLRGWTVTMLDADYADYGAAAGKNRSAGAQRVVGDVRRLPFTDRAFDVVVAIDLLEHVPPQGRAQAVRELCRVARRQAVIACPAGAQALAADRRIARRLVEAGRDVPGWLSEHLDNGFPEAAVLADLAAAFGRVELESNESLAAHECLVLAELRPLSGIALRVACIPLELMLASARPRSRRLAARLLGRVRGGDTAPAYRALLSVERAPESSPEALKTNW